MCCRSTKILMLWGRRKNAFLLAPVLSKAKEAESHLWKVHWVSLSQGSQEWTAGQRDSSSHVTHTPHIQGHPHHPGCSPSGVRVTSTMGHQRGVADLGDAPGAPLLPPVPAGAHPELVIHVGVDVQHHELCLWAHVHVLKVAGSALAVLQPVVLGYEIIIHLQKHSLPQKGALCLSSPLWRDTRQDSTTGDQTHKVLHSRKCDL